MSIEQRGRNGAEMLGATESEMLNYEVNRQKYNPMPVSEKPKSVEQPDIRDVLHNQRSMLHKILRHIGMEK
ncbi:MAG: hypothetical protein M1400_01240 [Patescibacteria group bacterium]|nr:hypothetical protein [Patescibacteria group bacterium]